ncbi:hypothetical protein B0J14DRAFT_609242 [Halenospora varia]|nr:hypothetical protein B0J14DRAFT_609242 [Halenospora varia]
MFLCLFSTSCFLLCIFPAMLIMAAQKLIYFFLLQPLLFPCRDASSNGSTISFPNLRAAFSFLSLLSSRPSKPYLSNKTPYHQPRGSNLPTVLSIASPVLLRFFALLRYPHPRYRIADYSEFNNLARRILR